MVSAEQRIRIDQNILKAVQAYLISGGTMKEVAQETGLTPSTVQRYLNSERIIELLDQEVYDDVQEKLKQSTIEARSRGGVASTRENIGIRSEDGKFIGNRKR